MSELPKPELVQIWREAMAQLRYLNDEVWKRFQFFIWLELVLLIVAGESLRRGAYATTLILFAIGLVIGVLGRHILRRNRTYYLQMLARKSLLEEKLGLYAENFEGTELDHAFPWRLSPEVIQKVKANSDSWVESSIQSPGTIARFLFRISDLFIALHGLGTLLATINLLHLLSRRL